MGVGRSERGEINFRDDRDEEKRVERALRMRGWT